MNGRALPLTVVVLLVIGIFFSILPFSSLGAVPRAYATTSTLVQDNKNSQPFTCTHASSCTVSVNFPSNVHSGDVVVVGVIDSVDPIFCGNTTVGYCSPTSSLSISDSLHSSYSVAKTLIDSSSYGSLFIYDATLSSSGADAITVADSTTNANGLWVFIFEVSGVTTSSASTGAGGPTIFSTPSTSTSTSSVTFSPGSFLLAVVLSDGTSASPEGGFTSFAFSSQSSAQNAMYTEYATSGVSSPTIFPASVTAGTLTPAFWDEVGIALQPLPSRNAVNLSTPCIEGLQVDINGDTTSGQNVSKIVFNWGDGTIQSHLFPFEHTYKAPGTYSIIVTAYYKDGSTAFASTKVTVGSVVGMGCFSLVLSSSDGGTVHYVRDGNVSGSVASGKSQTLYIAAGDDLELTAIPSGVGFPFASWAMEGNTTFISGSTTDAYIVIAVGANSTSNASFLEPNSPVACTISSGSTIQVGQSVSCSINQVVTWFVTDFSPSGYTTSSSENFMAVSNGKGAITASWGCTVGASPSLCVETFTYTIDPSTTIASCSVGDGSSIQLDATVTCTFTGDSNGFKFNGWGASDFTPYQSNSPTQTFTSNNEGKGEIRISWLDSSGAINYEGFNYQIGPNTAIASCTPDSGSTVELYTYVTCTFTGSGTFDGWLGSPPPTPTKTTSFTTQTFETTSITTSQVVKPKTAPPLTGQFSPYASGSTTQTFEANATGQAAITIFWSGTSQSGQTYESFTYTIAPSTAIASCNPGNSATVQLGSTVQCTFQNSAGTLLGWAGSGLTNEQPNSILPSNEVNPITFTATGTGSVSITVTYQPTGTSFGTINEETFYYNVPSSAPSGALTVTGFSPVNLLLTDPLGRMVGSNGITTFNQIPGAFYGGIGQEPQKIVLPSAIPGQYTLQAFGTGQGSYIVTLTTTGTTDNLLGNQTLNGTTTPGQTDLYTLNLANDGVITIQSPSPPPSVTSSSSTATRSSSTAPIGIAQFPIEFVSSVLVAAIVLITILIFRRKSIKS